MFTSDVGRIAAVMFTLVWSAQAISSFNLTATYPANTKVVKVGQYNNVTVQPNSLWYWCGFDYSKLTHFDYNATRAITTWFIRKKVLEKCDISAFDSCRQIEKAKCSRKFDCNMKLWGSVFGGDICFVAQNNQNRSFTINVKIHQHEDKTLDGGKAGSVIVLLLLIGWVFYPLVFWIYEQVVKKEKVAKH